MSARIDELRTALAELLTAKWVPVAPDEVLTPDEYTIDAKTLTGRKVMIFLGDNAPNSFPVTRGEDATDYEFHLRIVERYETQGRPTAVWASGLKAFVDTLEGWLGNARKVPYFELHPTWDIVPQESGVTTTYDIVDFMEDKLFVSVVTLVLREEALAPVT